MRKKLDYKEKIMTKDQFDEADSYGDTEFDFDDLDNKSKERGIISQIAGGIKDDLYSRLTSKEKFFETLGGVLPKEMGSTVNDAVGEFSTTVSELKEAARGIKPIISGWAATANAFVPQKMKNVKNFLDKFIEKDFSQQQQQQVDKQEQAITAALTQVFAQQQEQAQAIRAEEKAEAVIKEKIQEKKEKANYEALNNINLNLQRLTDYNSKVNLAYQKKMLEVQMRSLNVQTNTYGLLKEYIEKNAVLALKAIVKNTAMPEYVKINTSEAFKKQLKEKIFSHGIQLANDNSFTKWIKGFGKGLRDAIKGTMGQINSASDAMQQGLQAIAPSGDDAEEMYRQLAVMQISSWVGDNLRDHIRKELGKTAMMKKLRTKYADMMVKLSNAPAYFEDKLGGWEASMKEQLEGVGIADPNRYYSQEEQAKLEKKWKEAGFLKRMFMQGKNMMFNLARKGLQYGNQALGTSSTMSLYGNTNNSQALDSSSIFTKRVEKTITQIIPEYLARILQQVTIMASGDEKTKLYRWDFSNDRMGTSDVGMAAVKGFFSNVTRNNRFRTNLESLTKDFFKGADLDKLSKDQRETLYHVMFNMVGPDSTPLNSQKAVDKALKDALFFRNIDTDTRKLLKTRAALSDEEIDRLERREFTSRDMNDIIERSKRLDPAHVLTEADLLKKMTKYNFSRTERAGLISAVDSLYGEGEDKIKERESLFKSIDSIKNDINGVNPAIITELAAMYPWAIPRLEKMGFLRARRSGGRVYHGINTGSYLYDAMMGNKTISQLSGLYEDAEQKDLSGKREREKSYQGFSGLDYFNEEGQFDEELAKRPQSSQEGVNGKKASGKKGKGSRGSGSIYKEVVRIRELLERGIPTSGSIGAGFTETASSAYNTAKDKVSGWFEGGKAMFWNMVEGVRGMANFDPNNAGIKKLAELTGKTPEQLSKLSKEEYEKLKASVMDKIDYGKETMINIIDGLGGTWRDVRDAAKGNESAKSKLKSKMVGFLDSLKDSYVKAKNRLTELKDQALASIKSGDNKDSQGNVLTTEQVLDWFKSRENTLNQTYAQAESDVNNAIESADTASVENLNYSVSSIKEKVDSFTNSAMVLGGGVAASVVDLAKKGASLLGGIFKSKEQKAEEEALERFRNTYGDEGKSIFSRFSPFRFVEDLPGNLGNIFSDTVKAGTFLGGTGAKLFNKFAPGITNNALKVLGLALSGGTGLSGIIKDTKTATDWVAGGASSIISKVFSLGRKIDHGISSYKVLETVMDLTLGGQDQPSIYAKDMERGCYIDKKSGNIIRMIGDIRGDVLYVEPGDTDSLARTALVWTDVLNKGLYDNDGNDVSRFIIKNKLDARSTFSKAVGSATGEKGLGGDINEQLLGKETVLSELPKDISAYRGDDDAQKDRSRRKCIEEIDRVFNNGKLTAKKLKDIKKKYILDVVDRAGSTVFDSLNSAFNTVASHTEKDSIMGGLWNVFGKAAGFKGAQFSNKNGEYIVDLADFSKDHWPSDDSFKGKTIAEKQENAKKCASEIENAFNSGDLTVGRAKNIISKYTINTFNETVDNITNSINNATTKAASTILGSEGKSTQKVMTDLELSTMSIQPNAFPSVKAYKEFLLKFRRLEETGKCNISNFTKLLEECRCGFIGEDAKNQYGQGFAEKNVLAERVKAAFGINDPKKALDIADKVLVNFRNSGLWKKTKDSKSGSSASILFNPFQAIGNLGSILTGGKVFGEDEDTTESDKDKKEKKKKKKNKRKGRRSAQIIDELTSEDSKPLGIGGRLSNLFKSGKNMATGAAGGLLKGLDFLLGANIGETGGKDKTFIQPDGKKLTRAQIDVLLEKAYKENNMDGVNSLLAQLKDEEKEEAKARAMAAVGIGEDGQKSKMGSLSDIVGSVVKGLGTMFVAIGGTLAGFLALGTSVAGLTSLMDIAKKTVNNSLGLDPSGQNTNQSLNMALDSSMVMLGKSIENYSKAAKTATADSAGLTKFLNAHTTINKGLGFLGKTAKAVGLFGVGIDTVKAYSDSDTKAEKVGNTAAALVTGGLSYKYAVPAAVKAFTKTYKDASFIKNNGLRFKASLLAGGAAFASTIYASSMAGEGIKGLVNWAYKPDSLELLRLYQYGFTEEDSEWYPKLVKLDVIMTETALYENINGLTAVRPDKLDNSKLAEVFGIKHDTDLEDDPDAQIRFMRITDWLYKRYIPVYQAHANALKKWLGKVDFQEINKISAGKVHKYINQVEGINVSWNYLENPFTETGTIHGTKEEFRKLVDKLKGKAPTDVTSVTTTNGEVIKSDDELDPVRILAGVGGSLAGAKAGASAGAAIGSLVGPGGTAVGGVIGGLIGGFGGGYLIDGFFDNDSDKVKSASALDCIRYKMYGAKVINDYYVDFFGAMEQDLEKFLILKDDKLILDFKTNSVIFETLGARFDITAESPNERKESFLRWLYKRFLVVYVSYKEILRRSYGAYEEAKVRKQINSDYNLQLRIAVVLKTIDVWSCLDNPWGKDPEEMNNEPATVNANIEFLKNNATVKVEDKTASPSSTNKNLKEQVKDILTPSPKKTLDFRDTYSIQKGDGQVETVHKNADGTTSYTTTKEDGTKVTRTVDRNGNETTTTSSGGATSSDAPRASDTEKQAAIKASAEAAKNAARASLSGAISNSSNGFSIGQLKDGNGEIAGVGYMEGDPTVLGTKASLYAKESGTPGTVSYLLESMYKSADGAQYSQQFRDREGYYDCSSFLCRNAAVSGFNVNPNATTSSIISEFTKAGYQFIEMNPAENLDKLLPGDILIAPGKHVVTYVGDGKVIGAHSTKGGVGVKNFYDVGYTGILRMTGPNNDVATSGLIPASNSSPGMTMKNGGQQYIVDASVGMNPRTGLSLFPPGDKRIKVNWNNIDRMKRSYTFDRLGDLIARGESKGCGLYCAANSPSKGGLNVKDLDKMTIGEVKAQQAKGVFNAAGKYQFIRITLPEYQALAKLKDTDLFSPANQELLFACALLSRKRSRIPWFFDADTPEEAMMRLAAAAEDVAMEWASFEFRPNSGMPYDGTYSKNGKGYSSNNKASISRQECEQALFDQWMIVHGFASYTSKYKAFRGKAAVDINTIGGYAKASRGYASSTGGLTREQIRSTFNSAGYSGSRTNTSGNLVGNGRSTPTKETWNQSRAVNTGVTNGGGRSNNIGLGRTISDIGRDLDNASRNEYLSGMNKTAKYVSAAGNVVTGVENAIDSIGKLFGGGNSGGSSSSSSNSGSGTTAGVAKSSNSTSSNSDNPFKSFINYFRSPIEVMKDGYEGKSYDEIKQIYEEAKANDVLGSKDKQAHLRRLAAGSYLETHFDKEGNRLTQEQLDANKKSVNIFTGAKRFFKSIFGSAYTADYDEKTDLEIAKIYVRQKKIAEEGRRTYQIESYEATRQWLKDKYGIDNAAEVILDAYNRKLTGDRLNDIAVLYYRQYVLKVNPGQTIDFGDGPETLESITEKYEAVSAGKKLPNNGKGGIDASAKEANASMKEMIKAEAAKTPTVNAEGSKPKEKSAFQISLDRGAERVKLEAELGIKDQHFDDISEEEFEANNARARKEAEAKGYKFDSSGRVIMEGDVVGKDGNIDYDATAKKIYEGNKAKSSILENKPLAEMKKADISDSGVATVDISGRSSPAETGASNTTSLASAGVKNNMTIADIEKRRDEELSKMGFSKGIKNQSAYDAWKASQTGGSPDVGKSPGPAVEDENKSKMTRGKDNFTAADIQKYRDDNFKKMGFTAGIKNQSAYDAWKASQKPVDNSGNLANVGSTKSGLTADDLKGYIDKNKEISKANDPLGNRPKDNMTIADIEKRRDEELGKMGFTAGIKNQSAYDAWKASQAGGDSSSSSSSSLGSILGDVGGDSSQQDASSDSGGGDSSGSIFDIFNDDKGSGQQSDMPSFKADGSSPDNGLRLTEQSAVQSSMYSRDSETTQQREEELARSGRSPDQAVQEKMLSVEQEMLAVLKDIFRRLSPETFKKIADTLANAVSSNKESSGQASQSAPKEEGKNNKPPVHSNTVPKRSLIDITQK